MLSLFEVFYREISYSIACSNEMFVYIIVKFIAGLFVRFI